MSTSLKINEIFYSIQGESTKSGLPCVFVRLTYCNLRCVYCDTEYAFFEGKDMEIDTIIKEVNKYEWSKEIIRKYDLQKKCSVLMSPVFSEIENIDLVNWIIADKLNVRFQIQLHKYIWHPETRGV